MVIFGMSCQSALAESLRARIADLEASPDLSGHQLTTNHDHQQQQQQHVIEKQHWTLPSCFK